MNEHTTPSLDLIQEIAVAADRPAAITAAGISPTAFYRWCRKYGVSYQTASNPPSLDLIQEIAEAPNRTAAMKASSVPPATFYRWCRNYGVPYQNERSSYILSTEDDALILRLSKAGFTSRQLGEKFEVCHTSILKRLKRHRQGIPTRSSKKAEETKHD